MELSLQEESRRVKKAYDDTDGLLRGIDVERKMIAERLRRLDQIERLALGLKCDEDQK
jgi:hypothetical protein